MVNGLGMPGWHKASVKTEALCFLRREDLQSLGMDAKSDAELKTIADRVAKANREAVPARVEALRPNGEFALKGGKSFQEVRQDAQRAWQGRANSSRISKS